MPIGIGIDFGAELFFEIFGIFAMVAVALWLFVRFLGLNG